MLKEVHFYTDETFIYRDDAGRFSFYIPGDQHMWGKATGGHQRWGIVHGIFDYYQKLDEDEVEAGPEPPRKQRKKNAEIPPNPKGYRRKFETHIETFKCWSCSSEGNMDTEKFLEWLETVLQFFQDGYFDEDDILVVHLDNASYHKTSNPEFFDVDAKNVKPQQIAVWILENAPAEYGYDDISTLHDENGKLLPVDQLKWIVKNHCHNHPQKILDLVKSYDKRYRVEFTPPYWPHVAPPELMWNNLKLDYRRWDSKDKIRHVAASVRTFMNAVTEKDCEGYVRKTDQFCIKIANRDEELLKELELSL